MNKFKWTIFQGQENNVASANGQGKKYKNGVCVIDLLI